MPVVHTVVTIKCVSRHCQIFWGNKGKKTPRLRVIPLVEEGSMLACTHTHHFPNRKSRERREEEPRMKEGSGSHRMANSPKAASWGCSLLNLVGFLEIKRDQGWVSNGLIILSSSFFAAWDEAVFEKSKPEWNLFFLPNIWAPLACPIFPCL